MRASKQNFQKDVNRKNGKVIEIALKTEENAVKRNKVNSKSLVNPPKDIKKKPAEKFTNLSVTPESKHGIHPKLTSDGEVKGVWYPVLKNEKVKSTPTKTTLLYTKCKRHAKHPEIVRAPRIKRKNGTRPSDSTNTGSTSKLGDGAFKAVCNDCSDSSFEDDLVSCMDRSVQCNIISIKDLKSNKITYYDRSLNLSDLINLNGGTFALYNPVHSMKFLIKEMRDVVRKGLSKASLMRIISDMEESLSRIPSESNLLNYHATCEPHSSPSRETSHPIKNKVRPYEVYRKAESLTDLKVAGEDRDLIHSSLKVCQTSRKAEFCNLYGSYVDPMAESHRNSSQISFFEDRVAYSHPIYQRCRNSLCKVDSERKIQEIGSTLQNAVKKLESACQQLQDTCSQVTNIPHLEVKENKQRQFAVSSQTITENFDIASKKTEEYCKTVQQMSILTSILKRDNNLIPNMRESQLKLSQLIKERSQENDKLRLELQAVKMENEKLATLVNTKNQDLEMFQSELTSIKQLLSKHLVSIKEVSAAPLQSSDENTSSSPDYSADNRSIQDTTDNPKSSSPTFPSSRGVSPSCQETSNLMQGKLFSDRIRQREDPFNVKLGFHGNETQGFGEFPQINSLMCTVIENPVAEDLHVKGILGQLDKHSIGLGISQPLPISNITIKKAQRGVILTDISNKEQLSKLDKNFSNGKQRLRKINVN